MTTDRKFLEEAPDGFDPTMELKWVYVSPENLSAGDGYILCQKYRGAFRDCWVRVPIDL